MLGLNNNTDSDEMNTPALNGNEGAQERQESSDVNLILRGKQPKKVEINKNVMFLEKFENKKTTLIVI